VATSRIHLPRAEDLLSVSLKVKKRRPTYTVDDSINLITRASAPTLYSRLLIREEQI
jgi:hypothetical protein